MKLLKLLNYELIVTKSPNMNVRNVSRLDVFIKYLLNYYELYELLWSYWTMMKLLKLLNYELIIIEVIELWWTYWI